MTFAGIEGSRSKGSPVNCFYIKYGESDASYFGYTTGEKTIVIDIDGPKTFVPVAIDRGNISVNGKLDKASIEVRMSLALEVAELFRIYPPSQVVTMMIIQGHITDPDEEFLVCWSGRIISGKRTETEFVITGEPINTSMKRVGLRRHMQYSCPHALYGDKCKASKTAATMNVVVEAVGLVHETTVTLPIGWVTHEQSRKYLGGMVEWTNSKGDTEIRTILRVSIFRKLLLSGLLRDLEAGMTIKVILGCNHDFVLNGDKTINEKTDCHFLHNNIQNFGGCKFIPRKNPVGSNVFY